MREISTVPEHTPTVSQYEGAILGCAVGDAVGAMVETRSPQDCESYINKVLVSRDWERLTRLTYDHRDPGQYTDDTQLSRLLAQALVEHLNTQPDEHFDPEEFSQRFCEFVTDKEIVGSGTTTRRAAMRLLTGTPWQSAGEPAPAGSNGSAMRAAPVGLAYFYDWEYLVEAAINQSRVSHASRACQMGSVAMATATAMCLVARKRTSTPAETGWWKWLSMCVSNLDGGVVIAEPLDDLIRKHFLEKQDTKAIQSWITQDLDDGGWKNGGVSPYVVPSVIAAFYAVMDSPTDYWQTVQTAISFGGDVDTIAAMAGALSGALNGVEAIPAELTTWVHDKGSWGAVELSGLAQELHGAALSRRASAAENK